MAAKKKAKKRAGKKKAAKKKSGTCRPSERSKPEEKKEGGWHGPHRWR